MDEVMEDLVSRMPSWSSGNLTATLTYQGNGFYRCHLHGVGGPFLGGHAHHKGVQGLGNGKTIAEAAEQAREKFLEELQVHLHWKEEGAKYASDLLSGARRFLGHGNTESF